MPIYEYQCLQCGHVSELLQRHGDSAPACPECGGETKRLVSAPAFQFKGQGWYVTDYARKSGAPAGESAKKSEAAASGGTSDTAAAAPKPDTKPAATPPKQSD